MIVTAHFAATAVIWLMRLMVCHLDLASAEAPN